MLLSLQWNSFEEFSPLRPRGGEGERGKPKSQHSFCVPKGVKLQPSAPQNMFHTFQFENGTKLCEKRCKVWQKTVSKEHLWEIYSLHCTWGGGGGGKSKPSSIIESLNRGQNHILLVEPRNWENTGALRVSAGFWVAADGEENVWSGQCSPPFPHPVQFTAAVPTRRCSFGRSGTSLFGTMW